MSVKDVMVTDLFVLNEDSKISSASDAMSYKNIRHIPIVDKDFKLVGLVTHRDLLGSLARKLSPLQVKDIMTRELKTVETSTPIDRAIELMILNKFGCLPVVDSQNKLLGIVTEIDLLKKLYEISRTVIARK